MKSATRTHTLYSEVEAALSADIAAGLLAAGDQLPSEDQLAERFGVSRITVRKAVENLVGRGIVEIRRGRGTFVREPRIVQELTQLTGFVEDMHVLGRTPTARLLDAQLVAADDDVARELGLPKGSHVMRFRRVRSANGQPVSFDETYLPREIGEAIAMHNLDDEPIFALLEERYSIPLTEAQYQLEAVAADALVATSLDMEPGAPCFLIERTSYTVDNKPIDYERLYYRGDQIRFVTRLARRTPHSPSGQD
jgi:GntR family transcriptional regulator